MTLYDPWSANKKPRAPKRRSRWHAALIWGHVAILMAYTVYLLLGVR